MKPIALAFLIFSLAGCNSIHRLVPALGPKDNPTQSTQTPDIYTIEGVTGIDYQIIQPVRCLNSSIRVWVKRPDMSDFEELNKYEFQTDTTGTGGGGVTFGRIEHATFNSNGDLVELDITSLPVAPKGTSYKIESTLLQRS